MVLDLASVEPKQALRIPSATWFRYRRAAQESDAILLLLTKESCARSSAACVLLCSAGEPPKMQGVLTGMLETILHRAMECAYALRTVRLTLQLERAEPHTVQVRPATPTQDREVLLKLLNLELQAHPPQARILAVTLEAEPAQPQTAQRGLFQAQFPEPDKLDLLLARLRSIAGEGNVGSPQLENSHRDDAFTMAPFRPSLRAMVERALLPSRLAVRMFRPPQAVRLTCRDNQPRTLFWQGARFEITMAAGPWHSSGSWWDGQAWDCDLRDVVTAEPAQALRLRQEHASKAWFVVGLYD